MIPVERPALSAARRPRIALPARPPDAGRPRFLGGVESLRGLAALCVAVWHTVAFFPLADYRLPVWGQTDAAAFLGRTLFGLCNGPAAVVLFFAISGLVLGLSLDAHPVASAKEYGRFLGRRFLRIYPAHIAVLVAVAAAGAAFFDRPPFDFQAGFPAMDRGWQDYLNGVGLHPFSPSGFALNLALFRSPVSTVTWSLHVEVYAAFLLPLFHLASRKRDARVDALLFTGLLALALIFRESPSIGYLFVFYLGMGVHTHGPAYARWIGLRWSRGAAILLSLAAIALPALLIPALGCWTTLPEALGSFSLLSLLVHGPRAVSPFLERPALRWLGRLSYPFYLLHWTVALIVARTVYEAFPPSTIFAHRFLLCCGSGALSIAAALALAQLCHVAVEVPCLRLGRRRAR